MFGYVSICEAELKRKDYRRYKQYYCGLCHTLKERYGFLGQMTLTYDMTFAILLLSSLYGEEARPESHRCKTHPFKEQPVLRNDFTEYGADMNLLLAYFQLEDDWRDEGSKKSRLLAWKLKRRARRVAARYPRQTEVIRRELEALFRLEEANCQTPDEPAGCFGRLMGEVLACREDHWAKSLRRLGFYLGKFIYLMDAYEDLEKDLGEGRYNPLKEEAKKAGYEERIREILQMMAGEAALEFEKLPCLQEGDILRNILYGGVWTRYRKHREEKSPGKEMDNP